MKTYYNKKHNRRSIFPESDKYIETQKLFQDILLAALGIASVIAYILKH